MMVSLRTDRRSQPKELTGFSIAMSQAPLLDSYRATEEEVKASFARLARLRQEPRRQEERRRLALCEIPSPSLRKTSIAHRPSETLLGFIPATIDRFQRWSLAHLVALHPELAAELVAAAKQEEAA